MKSHPPFSPSNSAAFPAVPVLLVVLLLLSAASSPVFGGLVSYDGKRDDIIDATVLTSNVPAKRVIFVGPSEKLRSVQAGIDAVPEGNSEWVIVHLRSGIYSEKVVVPANKPYIYLRGNGKGRTAIVWHQSSDNNTDAAAFSVFSDNFIAFGISFKNDARVGLPYSSSSTAVAAMVAGDKVAFYHCAFYSSHKTVFDHKGRHFYESCYFQGNIDFIFGRGQSIFQSCEVFVLTDRRTKILGSIAAQNRKSEDDHGGFVFLKGKVYGIGNVFLGRANEAFSRVVFSDTYLSKTIAPAGWTNWSYSGSTENLLIGEHKCHGPGAEASSRVPWSKQLSDEEAAPFTSIDFIDGKDWLPAYY